MFIRMANGSLFTLDKDFYKNNKALLDAEFARRGYSFVFGEGSKEQIEATNASADKEKAAYEKRMATFENEQRAETLKQETEQRVWILKQEIADIERKLAPGFLYEIQKQEILENFTLTSNIEEATMFIRKEAAKANDANAIFIRKQKEIKEKEERIGKLKADLDEIKRTMAIAANDEAMSNLIVHANATQRMISELQNKNDIANMQMFEQDMLKEREEIRKRIEEKQAEIEKAKARQEAIKKNQENGYKNSDERKKYQELLFAKLDEYNRERKKLPEFQPKPVTTAAPVQPIVQAPQTQPPVQRPVAPATASPQATQQAPRQENRVKNVSDSNKDYKVIGAILTVAGAITSWSLPIIGAFPGAVTLATGIAFLVKGLLPEKEGKSK